MDTPRRLVRILVTAMVLGAIVLTVPIFSPRITAAQEIGIIEGSVTQAPYGTFNGIAYVKYSGRFMGLASGEYDVPFEIIAPADPGQGNGITVMEPFRFGSAGLEAYLTPEFLFERGFSYAGIGWHLDSVPPDAGYSTEQAVEILYNFGMTLREDDVAHGMVGEVQMLYDTGVSLATAPLLALLALEETAVLDFSFLFVPELNQETYSPHEDSGNIMVFLTESDLVRALVLDPPAHTDVLRGSASNYRSYEVAGGPHIPDVPWVRDLGWGSEDTTPLDWTPVARALFLAGHRWTTEGIEAPPSAYLAEAPEGEIDSVYLAEYGLELETGIARDEDGNALGGIRMPDLEIGRGQYIAFDPPSLFGFGLFGTWYDLKCEPRQDGSPRFSNHGAYVSQFTHHTQRLVEDGYLLPGDAHRLILEAAKSDVGKPDACAQ